MSTNIVVNNVDNGYANCIVQLKIERSVLMTAKFGDDTRTPTWIGSLSAELH